MCLNLGKSNCHQACAADSRSHRFIPNLVSHRPGVCISRRVQQSRDCEAPADASLSNAGYFVTAPDLLGHGNARRSSDYTIATLTEELRPLFTTPGSDDHPYHIVIGHSLGGIVASALLPILKSTRPVHVVLVDPPLEQTPELVAFYRKHFGDVVRNPKTPEEYLQEHPEWTREDAIFRSLSLHLCDPAIVEAIFDVGLFTSPWWSALTRDV